MKEAKRLSILLTCLLTLSLAYLSCANGTTDGDIVPGDSLAAKLAWLDENAESEGDYLIELDADESAASVELSYGDRTGITVTLKGTGENRTISLASSPSIMFEVGAGVTLVLDRNITLKGRNDNTRTLVSINRGGTLIMNDGSVITGNKGEGVGLGRGIHTSEPLP